MSKYFVTGAAGGIGSAVCRLLTDNGHHVWGTDRVPADTDGKWTFLPADITSSKELQAVFQQVRADAGELDGIIHTTGVYDLNSLVEMPEEDFVRDFNVNLFGMFRVNRLFVPLLRSGGRIVMISSELAPLDPLPFTGVYAITKAAVEKYADSLRMEVQLLGHHVTVIRPGAVKTDMLPASTEKLDSFCSSTVIYKLASTRFRDIVDKVENRSTPPEKIAGTILKCLTVPRPKLVYCINRNPLLLVLNSLPRRMQLWIIRGIIR